MSAAASEEVNALEEEWRKHLIRIFGCENLKEAASMINREYENSYVYDTGELAGKILSKRFGGVLNVIIYLSKGARGRGLGCILLDGLEERCREENLHRLEIQTIDECEVKDYYKNKGFEELKIPQYYFRKALYLYYKMFEMRI